MGAGACAPVGRCGPVPTVLTLQLVLLFTFKSNPIYFAAMQFWPLINEREYVAKGASAQPGLKAKPRHPRLRLVFPGRCATPLAPSLGRTGRLRHASLHVSTKLAVLGEFTLAYANALGRQYALLKVKTKTQNPQKPRAT